MATIMVPVMAAFERDLLTNLKLLEEIVKPAGHEIGLGVIGKPSHFLEQEQRAKMIGNLNKYAKGLKIASHQWSGNVIYDPSPGNLAFSDLRTERGRKVINCGVDFAVEAINTGIVPENQEVYVHTHGGDIYFGKRMPENELQYDRALIRQNLVDASNRNPRVIIGLENLPHFPNSDDPELINFPEKIGRSVFECLGDYKEAVEGTKLKLTFDTAHYGYEFPIGDKIDLVSAIDIFGEHLRHVHISDAKGYWAPYVSIAGDGLVPGQGKIGEEEFIRFFRHLRNNYDLSKVSIEAEVQDADYQNPKNRRETLKRIVKWL